MPQLARRSFSLVSFSSTSYRAGTSIFASPPGKIKRLGTFTSKTFLDFVFYDYAPREFLDRRIAGDARIQSYGDAVPTPPGMFSANTVTDKGYRAERGLYTRDNRNTILWPHLEAGEHVLIEWTGRKTYFDDDEPVDLWHYERQVQQLIATHLQKEHALRDDRNVGDAQALDLLWRENLGMLKIQAKDDEEPEEILWDTGLMPRYCMPVASTATCEIPSAVDEAMPFFTQIWLFCEEDGNYYNLFSLLVDSEAVVLDLNDSESDRPLSEATFETFHVEQLLVQNPTSLEFHPLIVTDTGGDPTVAFDVTGQDGTDQTVSQGACVRRVDIKADNSSTIYRLTVELVASVPTVVGEVAPDNSTTSPAVLADVVAAPINYLLLLDQATAVVKKLRVYNDSLSISDHAFQESGVANTVAMRDSADRDVKLLSIFDGSITISSAPTKYVTSPDVLRFKDQYTGDLRLLRLVNEQTKLTAV